MKFNEQKRARTCAESVAREVGKSMRQNLRNLKVVNETTAHDIKLELDVKSQRLIEKRLLGAFPKISILGEEGSTDSDDSEARWVVDPIDGTVNFAYGIPHACVSIALQELDAKSGGYVTTVGVVYDPFSNEMWTAIRGKPALLNGKPIHVSSRRDLKDCIISIGFAKSRESLNRGLPYFNWLVKRVRKVRIMGAAALSLTYVATGRFDAYIEGGVSLWDIAAGGLIIECAGGRFWTEARKEGGKYRMLATNGLLHDKLPLPR
jgi:myo-inositol-1(or 4)-monophosphatase